MILAELLNAYHGRFEIYRKGELYFRGNFEVFCEKMSIVETSYLGGRTVKKLTCKNNLLQIYLQ